VTRRHSAHDGENRGPHTAPSPPDDAPDLGDLLVVLLAATLESLRDSLARDGFVEAAMLVADLVDISDDYITNCIGKRERWHR
jgi:hypothetical protein